MRKRRRSSKKTATRHGPRQRHYRYGKGNTNDSVMSVWACRLYWCLTSNDGVSRMISQIEPVVDQVFKVIRMHSEQKNAVLLVEAALGVISNLLKRVEPRNQLDSPDTFLMALDLMHIHSRHPGVMIEAYCLTANLASFSVHKNAVAEAGEVGFIVSAALSACSLLLSIGGRAQCDRIDSLGVEAVVKAIRNSLEFRDVLEVACVTLWGLIQGNDGRKERVAKAGGIDAVTCAIVIHPDDISIQGKACGILASQSLRKEVAERLAGDAGVSDATEVLLHDSSSAVLLTPCVVFLKSAIPMLPSFAEDP